MKSSKSGGILTMVNTMNKLETLVQELCPQGIEYKRVKDTYKRIKGTPITAAKMKQIATPDGSIRIFAGGKQLLMPMKKTSLMQILQKFLRCWCNHAVSLMWCITINRLHLKMKCGLIRRTTL